MTWTVPGLRNTHVESSEASGVFNIPETLSTATLPRSPGRHMRHPGVDVPCPGSLAESRSQVYAAVLKKL